MQYRVTHTTKFQYADPAPVCNNLVHLAPRHLPWQKVLEFRLLVHPDPKQISSRPDYFGNQVSYFAIAHAHRGVTISAHSHVEVAPIEPPISSPPWERVTREVQAPRPRWNLDTYQYLFPSRHVPLLAELREYALASFLAERPICEAVAELMHRIHQDFNYDPTATLVHTPLGEAFEKRAGVCQDFAHVGIGCLRALGIPARYVSGYLRTNPPPGKPRLVGADASHAWFGAYCGQELGWVDFDPTNDLLLSIDHITSGWGRDYDDVCPVQGVVVGGGQHAMSVSVDVEPFEIPAEP